MSTPVKTVTALNSVQNARLKTVVPEVIPHYLKRKGLYTGIGGKRDLVRITPDLNNYDEKSQRIRFTLPNDSEYDFHRAYLRFYVSFRRTGGSYVRAMSGIWNMFRRVRLLSDVTEIENLEEYGRLQSWLWDNMTEQDVEPTIGYLHGIGDQAQRNLWSSGREYSMPIICGWLTDHVLPMNLIKSYIYFDWYFADIGTCLEADTSTGLGFNFSQVELVVERLRFYGDAYTRMLLTLPAMGGHFSTWDVYTVNIDGNKIEYNIPHKSQSIVGLFALMVNTSEISNVFANDAHYRWNYNQSLRSQLRLYGEYIPERPVEHGPTSVQDYMNFLNFIGLWHMTGIREDKMHVTFAQYKTDKFTICFDMDLHPFEHGLMNLSEDTSQSHSQFLFQLEMNAIPPTAQTLFIFVHYHRVWALDRGTGRIQVNTQ